MSTLFNLSNRVVVPKKGKAVAGGLDNTLATCPGFDHVVRMGWSGDTIPDGDFNYEHPELHMRRELIEVNGKEIEYLLQDLPENDQEGHYERAANGDGWAGCHHRPDLVSGDPVSRIQYRRINEIFAQSISTFMQPDWHNITHDYHFGPLAEELHQRGIHNPNAMMWHIPFPDAGVINDPRLRDSTNKTNAPHPILEAAGFLQNIFENNLFAYDYVGAQAPWDITNWQSMLDAWQNPLHLDAYETGLIYNRKGQSVLTGISPATIDAAFVKAKADEYENHPLTIEFLHKARGWKIPDDQLKVFSVAGDRLDYAKGLPIKNEAIRKYLEMPDADPNFHHIQAAPFSRPDVKGYKEEFERFDSTYSGLRRDFRNVAFTPYDQITKKPEAVLNDILLALYRRAEMLLFTSIRDGAHLGAAEGIAAANPERPPVIILGKWMGAAHMFKDAALIVDATPDGIANGIKRGAQMSIEERKERYAEGVKVNKFNTNERWLRSLVDGAEKGAAMRSVPKVYTSDYHPVVA